jgi:uncharacterized protein (DUF433 family)
VSLSVQSERPPLREEADGAMRVGESRVLLELLIHAFQNGATPEEIVQQYPTLALPDVYSVISYYLRHRDEVEGYLVEREQRALEIRERIEQQQANLTGVRTRLLARRQGRS